MIIIKNHYAVPRNNDLLDQWKDGKYFTKLDLDFGYHQVCMESRDVWRTTSQNQVWAIKWLVMLLGLTNAPTTFMRLCSNFSSW